MADVGTPSIGLPLCDPTLIDNANNYYPNRISFEAHGQANLVQNTRVDVTNIGVAGAASVYAFPPAGGIQMRVISTSAADDGAPAGTGIQTLRIHYLDASYVEQTEDVTLNGITAVTTVATNILRLQNVHTITVGSSSAAVGEVTIENVAGTVVYARIEPAHNTSQSATFTVPAGKTAYLTHWNVFTGSATGTHYTRVTLRMTTHDHVPFPGVFLSHDAMGFVNGGGSVYYDVPLRLPATTDIKVTAISDAGNANVFIDSHFSGWYE